MIIFNNINFSYDKKSKHLFKNLSFEIKEHNFCAILGRSGAGKSSLLHLIAGIENINDNEINDGEIILRNQVVDSKTTIIPPEKRNIAMIFQTPSLFSHKNVLENIIFGMQKLDWKKKEKVEVILEFLSKIKMSDYAYSFPSQLSVGQQQRIAFARALLSSSDIILLDEPFSGLDFESKFLLYNLLLEVKQKSQKTIVLVTHDFDEAAFFANQFLIVNDGVICKYNSIEEIYFHPCSKYTASLFQFTNLFEGKCICGGKVETIFGLIEKSKISCCHKENQCVVNYSIRPEHLKISNSKNGLKAIIQEIKFFGSYYILLLSIKAANEALFMKIDKINNLKIKDEIYIELSGGIMTF